MTSSKNRDEYQCSSKTPEIFPTFCAFQHDANTPPDSPQCLVQRFNGVSCSTADAEPRRVYGANFRGNNGAVGGVDDRLVETWAKFNDQTTKIIPNLVDVIRESPPNSPYTLFLSQSWYSGRWDVSNMRSLQLTLSFRLLLRFHDYGGKGN